MCDRADKGHIVVIDDSLEYLRFMEVLLHAEGFSVSTLSSADRLPDVIATTPPSLVITDVCLPGQAPFSVLDHLRSQAGTASIPVLVCTGAVNEVRERPETLELSGVDLLMKPFDVDDLLSRIASLLPQTSASPETVGSGH